MPEEAEAEVGVQEVVNGDGGRLGLVPVDDLLDV